MISHYKGKYPDIAESAFIATNAVITGDVKIGEKTNVWYFCSIRGDVAPTEIGERVSIQDNSVLHQSPDMPLIIEDGVVLGHNTVLHACKVRKNALIGMSSTVLDDAEVGEGAMIAAGSLVPPGKKIPPNSLAMGSPAKVVRELNETDIEEMNRIRETYVERGQYYKELEKEFFDKEER